MIRTNLVNPPNAPSIVPRTTLQSVPIRLRGLLFAAVAVFAAGLGLFVVHGLSFEEPHAAEQLVEPAAADAIGTAPDRDCAQPCVTTPFDEDALIACVLALVAVGLAAPAVLLAPRPPRPSPIAATRAARPVAPSLVELAVSRI